MSTWIREPLQLQGINLIIMCFNEIARRINLADLALIPTATMCTITNSFRTNLFHLRSLDGQEVMLSGFYVIRSERLVQDIREEMKLGAERQGGEMKLSLNMLFKGQMKQRDLNWCQSTRLI